MYICLCKAVTDKDIHRAVQNGASTMRCLRQQSGVGTQCGRCVGHAKEVLVDALGQAPASHALPAQKEPVTIATAPGIGICYP